MSFVERRCAGTRWEEHSNPLKTMSENTTPETTPESGLPSHDIVRHPVNTVEMANWLETVAGFALSDMLKALEKGNLEAAQAHSERIKILEYIAPWIGAEKAYIGIRLNYSLPNKEFACEAANAGESSGTGC